VDLATLLTGIGAILTSAGGCALVIHEFRRRDRQALKRELDELAVDVSELRHAVVICRRYAYLLLEKLAHHGIDIPDTPDEARE
jgi:hypothetical protein